MLASYAVPGLADHPAWHVVLLTSRGEMFQLLLHVNTYGMTWHRVKVDGEVG